MDYTTLQALKGSIAKWQKIVDGTGEDEGVLNCPLCELFWHNWRCSDACPVKARTGQDSCQGSPYFKYAGIDENDYKSNRLYRFDLLAAAKKELAFLQTLLPEEVEQISEEELLKKSEPNT